MSRLLSPQMEADLSSGTLQPLLEVVQKDRDLLLECRGANLAIIYCKGHAIRIERCGEGNYKFHAAAKFLAHPHPVQSREAAVHFVEEQLPHIKQLIATHDAHGTELELQQLLVRANNGERKCYTDYFVVDQQVVPEQVGRFDCLGIYWPGSARSTSTDVSLALIEVKFALGGGVEKIAEQVRGYYDMLVANIDVFAAEAEELLRQKLRLGLISGASPQAQVKLATLPISRDPKRVKIVLALVDYNPRSTRFDPTPLNDLREQVRIFRLGLGLWEQNAEELRLSSAKGA